GKSDDASRLIGAWRLVSYEDRSDKGETLYPYGREPRGILMYDAAGSMSIQIMKMPHSHLASGSEDQVAPDEQQTLFDSYIAYFGRYSVDMARGIVTTHVEGDLYDVYVGRDEARPFHFDGDRLVLTPDWTLDGIHWQGTRIFERIKK